MLLLVSFVSNSRICSHLLHHLAFSIPWLTFGKYYCIEKVYLCKGACLSAGDASLAVLSFCSNAAL